MDISCTSNYYLPIFNNNKYIDQKYSGQDEFINKFPGGMKCECSKSNFLKLSQFKLHCKSTKHKKYLDNLTLNYDNLLAEYYENKDVLKTQQKLIVSQGNKITMLENKIFGLENKLLDTINNNFKKYV